MGAPRGSANPFYVHGLFSGWTAYRYESPPRPVGRVHSKAKREALARKVADLLREGDPTVFAREGIIRHGLRSSMVLKGVAWWDADGEAAAILDRAFAMLGAARPSWAEGQLGYIDPQPLAMLNADPVYQAKQRILSRSRNEARNCLRCGASFRPVRAAGAQQFCSVACRAKHFAGLRSIAEPTIQRACECCGGLFLARSKSAHYCSKRCTNIVDKFRRGVPPARVSPLVFDFVFRMAA